MSTLRTLLTRARHLLRGHIENPDSEQGRGRLRLRRAAWSGLSSSVATGSGGRPTWSERTERVHALGPCSVPLRDWQGREGPRLCLVFRQGQPDAVGTALDGPPVYRELHGDPVRLPPAFRIYSHDCPRHRPIYALCGSEEGVWTRTEIIPPDVDAE